MTWEYRIISHSDESCGRWYAVHEVHYDRGRIAGWTREPVRLGAESLCGLREMLNAGINALNSGILREEDLPK